MHYSYALFQSFFLLRILNVVVTSNPATVECDSVLSGQALVLSLLSYVTRRLISTKQIVFQQFTLVRWHRRIRFTIHDVTITFKLTDKIPSLPNSSPRTHSWSFYSVLHRPFPQLVSYRTSGGPIPSIPKLFSLFLFFLHSYRTQRFPRAL